MPLPIDVFFARNSKREKPELGDRFVPRRTIQDTNTPREPLPAGFPVLGSTPECPRRRAYHELLKENLWQPTRSLNFFAPRPRHKRAEENHVRTEENLVRAPPSCGTRMVKVEPVKSLDAPDVVNGPALKLLDWSVLNLVAVALDSKVFVMSFGKDGDHDVHELVDTSRNVTTCLPDGYVTSLAFACDGVHLSVGFSNGWIVLYDAIKPEKLRTIKDAHSLKVGSVCWNGSIMTSGSMDGTLLQSDTRVKHHVISKFKAHSSQIHSLSWSKDLKQLASAGKEPAIKIWELNRQQPELELKDFQGSTKAMCWSPFNTNHLVTGSLDNGQLRFWNTVSGELLRKWDCAHPITSVIWSPFQKEILTSHSSGTRSMYCWKYLSMAKIKEFAGHEKPILDAVCSPDGRKIVSISADCTVRIWKGFDEASQDNEESYKRYPVIR